MMNKMIRIATVVHMWEEDNNLKDETALTMINLITEHDMSVHEAAEKVNLFQQGSK